MASSKARREAAKARQGGYQRSDIGRASARARARLTTKHGYQVRYFRSLDRATEYAGSLPQSQQTQIIGHGTYNLSTRRYEEDEEGWASLGDLALPDYYDSYRDDIKDEGERIFKGGAKSYRVLHKERGT